MNMHRIPRTGISIIDRVSEKTSPLILFAAAMMTAILLSGCGGAATDSGSGDLSISLTDAAGDFAAYTVDVTALQLVNQDGTKVSALPTTTRVDFTQYANLSEFLTVASVPAGRYTQVILNLDFSNADIEVQDATGVRQATLQDAGGNPHTTLSSTLELDSGNPLVVAPGIPASLALDFDLSASNQVDFAQSPPVVQVEPFLIADLSLDGTREHRARGLLTNVDANAQTFEMHLRPFAVREREWGLITVATASDTHYEIDGVTYDGQAGIDQLGALADNAPVIVTGAITGKKQLAATEVLAGSSVPWYGKDVVKGTVIKRVGDTLTVRGHYIDRADGIAVFDSDIDITVDGLTKVTAPLSSQTAPDKDSISVGQAVTAFGTLDLSAAPYVLDSAGGDNLIRLNVTQLKATVGTANGTLLTSALAYIEGRRVEVFDFGGTGTTAADDSDPAAYDVDVGPLLSGTALPSGEIVEIRGFVAPYGQAGANGDFSAVSVIDLNQDPLGANMLLRWTGGASAPFSGIAGDAVVIDLGGVDNKNIRIAGVDVDLSGTPQLTLSAQDAEKGRYAIMMRGQPGIRLYHRFADFADALASFLNGGASVANLVAHGSYSAADTTLAGSVALVLMTR